MAPILRTFIKVIYDRGMRAVEASQPLPASFTALFGTAIITEPVRAGASDEFAFVSPGGALHAREQAFLSYLQENGCNVPETALLRDSVVAGLDTLMTLENPAETAPLPRDDADDVTGGK